MRPDKSPSAAELYGRGVFTTLALHDGEPFLWEKHWRRLSANAALIGIDLSEKTDEAILAMVKSEIANSRLKNGRVRITFSDQTPSRLWSAAEEKKTGLSIVVAGRRLSPESFKLTISPNRVNTTSPLVGVKSCNYLEHLLAYEEATKRGFDEAIRLNERGEVVSACMANVFWESDGKLFTPSLTTGCLPGTTREFILENVECEEVEAGIEEIENADRIFLTSAGIGVIRANAFEGRKLDASDHVLSRLLQF